MSAYLMLGAAGSFLLALALSLLTTAQWQIFAPTVSSLLVFALFALILYRRFPENVVGEIGFIYLALTLAYTVLPGITFLLVDFEISSSWVWEKLSLLLPEPSQLGLHLWRHVLFMSGVSIGYLTFRGSEAPVSTHTLPFHRNDSAAVMYLSGVVSVSIVGISGLSAPVESYIDHYVRFEHLDPFLLRVVYILLILKTSGYFLLLTLLFQNYNRYRLLIPPVVIAMSAYETAYSFGSRIETLGILLGTVCLYHYKVSRISLKQGFWAFTAIAALFSVIEIFRSVGFDFGATKDAVATEGASPASEFGAVFFTGFHLYSERAAGTLPKADALMFFNDILALVPFVDHIEWNPQYWYARNYFPEAIVPPQTNGPIADSAIWGGELDLLVRAIVSGAVYAGLMRWFIKRRNFWWATVIFTYCFATSVMALKYSVFYQLAPLLRIILPGLLILLLLTKIVRGARL